MNFKNEIIGAKDKNQSKPEKLAKIIYAAIVRYVKAENTRNREKSGGLALDFDRERRVNVHTENFD